MGFSFKSLWNNSVTGVLGSGLGKTLGNYVTDFKDWFDGTAAARKQNQMLIDNWNMQNAYNTPQAQMERYAAAGLNPNLIYSQSNMAGSIGSPSSIESGANQIGKAASTIAQIYGIKNMIAQNKNLEAQNLNIGANTSLAETQNDFKREEIRRYAHDTNWLIDHNLSSFSPGFERSFQVGTDYLNNFLQSPQGDAVVNALTTALGGTPKSSSAKFDWSLLNPFTHLWKGLGTAVGKGSVNTKMYPTYSTNQRAYRRAFNRKLTY